MANGHSGRAKRVAPIIALVIALAAVGVGYWWYTTQQSAQPKNVASGTIEATEYQVAPAIAGRIDKIVEEGINVKADEIVAWLDGRALDLQVQQAKAGITAAEAQITNAKDSGTDADVKAARARLAQAKAALALAKVQLEYSLVKAPHDGRVVAVIANVGQNASPGKTLVTISDPNDLYVRVFIPETEIGNVKLRDQVKITTDSTSKTYDGMVEYIASNAEFTPNNVETKDQRAKLVYEARVRVADTSGELKPGMPVDVTW